METLRFLMTSTFYPPYHLGGDAIHVKYLADELTWLGHEVHVMHSLDAYRLKRGNNGFKSQDDKRTHSLRSPYGRLSPLGVYVFGSSAYVRANYERLLKEISPDVVHHHNISLLGHELLVKQGDYFQLYTAHDYWLKCPKNDMLKNGQLCASSNCNSCLLGSGRPPQLWRKKINLDGLDSIICPSNFMAEQLGDLRPKMIVLPNFVPDPPANIPLVDNQNYFLYLGLIEEHKGIKILLKAFESTENKLIIGGSGSLSNWVKKTIEKTGMTNRVRYLNEIGHEKWSYLANASAVIIPSICFENSPLVALEALSVGTPVICSDMGGTKEIVEQISPELIMPTNDMFQRLKDLKLPDINKNHIRNKFQEKFSAKRYMEKYMTIVRGEHKSTS